MSGEWLAELTYDEWDSLAVLYEMMSLGAGETRRLLWFS
jgi:hypothetical protein